METGTVIFQSPHPLVGLTHRDGEPRAVSWGGFAFEPDERGINWVPVEAVKELTESHGMVGAPGRVARGPAAVVPDPRDLEIARLRARIFELEAFAPSGASVDQTTDGGATRPTVFPGEGEHPLGCEQPALGPAPTEKEVQASQSAPAAKVKKTS